LIVIEPLWVSASNNEAGESGADSCIVRSYFACMQQLLKLMQQPAEIMTRHVKQPKDIFAK